MNKINFFLIFFVLIISYEFLAIMTYVLSKQVWVNNLELIDFKFLLLETLFFGFVSYYLVRKKK
jgi:hypothetical protein